MTHIEKEWCNPFNLSDSPSFLINICTGRKASDEIQQNLSSFYETAKSKCEHFIENVLITGCTSFWEPVKKGKVTTFADTKTRDRRFPKKFVGSEIMFRRIVAAARFQSLNLSDLLSYELTSVPLCLFHEDESMRKTVKSDLVSKFEPIGTVACPQIINSLIIDGMVLIQGLNEKAFSTFNELAFIFLKQILSLGRNYKALRITVVFDRYDDESVKSLERRRRGDFTDAYAYEVSGNRKVVKFRNFLKLSENKRSLLKFVSVYILENSADQLQMEETMIIAGGFENPELCYSVNKNSVAELKDLKSNHYEADTRLIIHVLYEYKISHQKKVLVKSVDTDVFVLLIYYYSEFIKQNSLEETDLFMELGQGNKKRIISISEIVQKLENGVCECLPALHVLTGCDTTNAMFKIGKKTAYDVFSKNLGTFKDLSKLNSVSTTEAVYIATKFALALFRNKNDAIQTLNELRYQLTTTTNKSASELPPTDDAFYQHVLRWVYLYYKNVVFMP